MTPEDINRFFEARAPKFIPAEAAVGYILHALLQRDTYGTELSQQLTKQHPHLNVSDAVLYKALQFLERKQFIGRYKKELEGRGRPRQMFRLAPAVRTQAQELAQLWEQFVTYQ
ncbi:PadR family transcriptional regulator [Pantanalinema sp. GBBB05]|uniref:PadR family transcriptional regulator n=1 Tax=Pantanalinema sp. GBBB05 TaxID=2604139 RepID=UPI001D2354FF|nr:PadR family transcriptional regulator [Pantanalinema sp. GBBB05]